VTWAVGRPTFALGTLKKSNIRVSWIAKSVVGAPGLHDFAVAHGLSLERQ
jgi:hypothetical protein